MVKLLQNDLPTVPHLDHGWFGLRNRIPAEAHITDAERDEREIKEFAQPAWEGVGKDRTGIHSGDQVRRQGAAGPNSVRPAPDHRGNSSETSRLRVRPGQNGRGP